MPNLTVAEAREALSLWMADHAKGISDAITGGHLLDQLLAAHDAEAVEGDWGVREEMTAGWFVWSHETATCIPCPDETTARLYASFLNKADKRLAEQKAGR